MDKNDTFSGDVFEAGLQCVPLTAILSVTILMVLVSVMFNGFLLACSWSDVHRSTYAVCLVSMFTNNLIASCVGLPLYYAEHYTDDAMQQIPLQLANVLCIGHHILIFTCLAVGLCTLDIICWDRYEALTRLGKARRITPLIARRIIAAVAVIVVSFFMVTNISNFEYMSEGYYGCKSSEIEKNNQSSTIPMIVLVSIVIISSKSIAIFTLSSIGKHIRRHIAEVRQTLGNQNAVKELNLVKVSVVIFVTYTITWLPFGIARGLMNANPSPSVVCVYSVSYLWAFSLFSILPLLCICTDKKMRSSLWKIIHRNRVAPSTSVQSNGSS